MLFRNVEVIVEETTFRVSEKENLEEKMVGQEDVAFHCKPMSSTYFFKAHVCITLIK